VKLSVFDVTGKEVAILVNRVMDAGTHKIDFDASGFPSGVYFYRLSSGDYVSTKKMVLIK
ncbi:MAG: T9SS type A sorting domain-containing protein, partial [Ignavibacteria bacterium]|nr:T9SS type A sorting domain-containing protein [Ignavibacteria bacterium]